MDIVFLRDLRVDTVIGVYPWERQIRQKVILDLEFGTDARRAAATDTITDAIDYNAVATRLGDFIANSEFHLLETLAERVAELVRAEFGVSWVRVTLSKPGAVRGAQAVGVIIERGRRE
jgi:dihydroneopterin aldolase